ncbi:hypothetical protein H0H92_008105, partial [Tricholoma furcatifolium]
ASIGRDAVPQFIADVLNLPNYEALHGGSSPERQGTLPHTIQFIWLLKDKVNGIGGD